MYKMIKELFGLSDPQGFSEDEIAKVKRLYGRIPHTLELYYRELGREVDVNHSQNLLIVPWKYTWPKTENHLIIYSENQGVCFWGVSLNDLDIEDPPVYVTFDNARKVTWEPESKRLSDFLIAMAHVHAGFALPFSSKDISMISESEADIIRRHFKKKCEPLTRWVIEGVEFYGNHACDSIVMIRNGSDYDMYYASGKEDYYNEMRKALSTLGEAY